MIYHRYIAIYWVQNRRYIRYYIWYIADFGPDISQYIAIYRDISQYIVIYRDILRDILIYRKISPFFPIPTPFSATFKQNFFTRKTCLGGNKFLKATKTKSKETLFGFGKSMRGPGENGPTHLQTLEFLGIPHLVRS